MPKYCLNCGTKLPREDAKFCPECGYAFEIETVSEKETIQKESFQEKEQLTTARPNIAELGKKLEEAVEKILQAEGYETEKRRRLQGTSGVQHEIDVIAKKSGRIIAVECKNYSDPVSYDKLTHFAQKLQELDLEGRGIFASWSGFSSDAAQFAQSKHIETWARDEISEKFTAIFIGRGESFKGQSLTLEYALPLTVDFIQATQINLQNKDKVKVSNAELIYHPFFAYEYSFKAQVKDPTKKLHKFEDKDTLFVDALDGTVLNPMPQKGVGVITKALKVVASAGARAENERNKKLIQELRNNRTLREYPLTVMNDYRVIKLKPNVTPKEAKRSSIDFIIEKNTQKISYYPEAKEDSYFRERKSITYIPKNTDIRIINEDMIIVPRWSVDFDSFGARYTKEMFACSGTILEDTLSYCPRHFKFGAITIISRKTVAVCEICGQSLCEDHVARCPVCGKWLCEEHGIACSACQNRFCREHITLICPICNSSICDSCVTTCSICNTQYGKNHTLTCDRCGTPVCPNCVTTVGFIRKTRTCKKCAP